MNWGAKIILAYICFIALVSTMVAICANQDVDLVAPDYYKQEIAYQDQIDRVHNYNTLEKKPDLAINRKTSTITITFSEETSRNLHSGKILLFRPSNRRMDRSFEIELDPNGRMTLPIPQESGGLWKLKIQWADETLEYYHEKPMAL
ncbi:MAG: FixH family protein [Cyclobacteriaceae bacterium]